MNVLVIGSSGEALSLVKTLAGSIRSGLARLRVLAGNGIGRLWRRPDWVLVATADQRRLALQRFRLPTYRVVEVPELASMEALRDRRVDLEAALTRMVEIGTDRPVSRLGVGLARLLVQAWKSGVERRATTPDGAPFEPDIERTDREAREAAIAAARDAARAEKTRARREAIARARRAARLKESASRTDR